MNPPKPQQPAAPAPLRQKQDAEERAAEKADERLDEELDETFPASDPIPYRHDS